MRLPQLFRRSPADVVQPGAQDQAERLLAESLRALSQVCLKVADFIEAQRLGRNGADSPGKFLERLDRPAAPPRER